MVLNEELQAIERGERGETMKKVLNTLVMYGEAFGAEKMVPITGEMGHAVIGTGSLTWGPVFDLMQKLIDEGVLPQQKYTTDPRGIDRYMKSSPVERLVFKLLFSNQKRMENEWKKMGIKDENAYTCTCYMDEVGNIPQKGEILGWAESSAVSYANSVLGARCNRNSGILELLSNVLGYVPEFGLLTDEGRKADWVIEVKCDKLPEPQLLGSAIGFCCIEDVPYIKGLDRFLGTELTQEVKDYLKDMGAAAASNGSVGLYHVENLTPEAVECGASLIREGAKTFVVDEAEISRVKASYPVAWTSEGEPQMAFMGCPHFSLDQILKWTGRLDEGLAKNGKTKVVIPTIFCAAPDVREHFVRDYPDKARHIEQIGVIISGLCPLSYTSNPLTDKIRIITSSNKLRYYSKARFYSEEELVEIVTGGKSNG